MSDSGCSQSEPGTTHGGNVPQPFALPSHLPAHVLTELQPDERRAFVAAAEVA
jgi:hypothetical protein